MDLSTNDTCQCNHVHCGYTTHINGMEVVGIDDNLAGGWYPSSASGRRDGPQEVRQRASKLIVLFGQVSCVGIRALQKIHMIQL